MKVLLGLTLPDFTDARVGFSGFYCAFSCFKKALYMASPFGTLLLPKCLSRESLYKSSAS
jgi:hypothetical protein